MKKIRPQKIKHCNPNPPPCKKLRSRHALERQGGRRKHHRQHEQRDLHNPHHQIDLHPLRLQRSQPKRRRQTSPHTQPPQHRQQRSHRQRPAHYRPQRKQAQRRHNHQRKIPHQVRAVSRRHWSRYRPLRHLFHTPEPNCKTSQQRHYSHSLQHNQCPYLPVQPPINAPQHRRSPHSGHHHPHHYHHWSKPQRHTHHRWQQRLHRLRHRSCRCHRI